MVATSSSSAMARSADGSKPSPAPSRLKAPSDLEGEVSDARVSTKYSAKAFALIAPSRHFELFGMVAAEGALAGLPVVASRIGGLPEIVHHGETGLSFEPGDVASLSAALHALLRDKDRARAMGRRGRERAAVEFSVSRMTDRYEALYALAMANFRPPLEQSQQAQS